MTDLDIKRLLAIALSTLLAASADAQYWPMEPWTMTVGTLDSASGSHDGSMVLFPDDGSEWVVGRVGRSLEFDGVDRSVSLPPTVDPALGLIEHWVRPDSATGLQVIVYASDAPASADAYNGFGLASPGLEIHTGIIEGEFFALYQDGGGVPNEPGSGRWQVQGGAVQAGKWTHVAMAWNTAGKLTLYVDCVAVGSVTMSAGSFEGRSVTEQYMGRPGVSDIRKYAGLLDETRVGNSDAFEPRCEPARGETARFTAPVETAGEQFGLSMTADGDTLVVGSDDDTYVYTRVTPTSWRLEKTFGFVGSGTVFDLSRDTLIAGGFGYAVAIFERDLGGADQWGAVNLLEDDSRLFGRDVAIGGDRIVAGSPDGSSGYFHVFERDAGGADAWGEVARVFRGSEDFGSQVDIEGDVIAVADLYQVHIFYRNEGGPDAWGHVRSVSATGPGITHIELRGDALLMASDYVTVARRDLGGADRWGVEQRIRLDLEGDPPVLNATWMSDRQVAVARARSLYSSPSEPHVVAERIELFDRDPSGTWTRSALLQPRVFEPPQEIAWSSLGVALAVSGDTLLAGAPLNGRTVDGADVGQQVDAGRVLIFASEIFGNGFEDVIGPQ